MTDAGMPMPALVFWMPMPTYAENQSKQVEFWFVSVQTEKIICLFRGHPTSHYVS
jgi:hypothetical protein